MNRRKAIISIFTGAIGVSALGYVGWNYRKINKQPRLENLDNYEDMLGDLVDLIIPETNIPGAKQVGAHYYVILMIKDAKGIKEQNNFMTGLIELRDYCNDHFNAEYENCSVIDKIKVLTYFEKQDLQIGLVAKIRTKIFGKTFFNLLKELTIQAYCTSETGATQHLDYQYVPGKYDACVDIKKNQRTWATK